MRIRTLDLLKIAVTLVVSATLIALMLPVAAGAAGQLVTLVDSDSNSQAQVDSGKLRIGDGDGKLSIDGTILERDTMKGRVPFQDSCSESVGDGIVIALCDFDVVPTGKTLIITSVSIEAGQASSQSISVARVQVGTAVVYPVNVMTSVSGTRTTLFTFVGEFPLQGGAPNALVKRTASTGSLNMTAYLTGYLVDNA